MSRKIILLSDGTGNSSAKVWRTNVWRTFEALDLSGNDQVAYYDDGVGTSSFKPLAVLGGAFGFGLKRNVIALYKFACRNYRDANDEFYGFGFSRGAFTIRIVIGLIANQGLVKAQTEQDLDSLANAAYRAYRKERYSRLRLERPWQAIRNLFGPHYNKADNEPIETIRFIGVWDTVSAYGMPVKEMVDGIHRFLWPIELPDNKLSDKVRTARQALALDEERTTFHPQLWHEGAPDAAEIFRDSGRSTATERLCQVWFAGVHSNCGGGYPDDSLAYIPFVWMITEARRCGLKFKSDYANDPMNFDVVRADPDTFRNAIPKRDKDGRLYDPRKGLGSYYRYGPRKLVPTFYPANKKGEGDEVSVRRAKIHESVFRRIQNHAQPYAPIGVPALYDVVRDDGAIVTPDQFGFETNVQAAERSDSQEHAWDVVWRRRVVYFTTLAATLWLIFFPLFSTADPNGETYSPFRWISDLVRIVGAFLPSWCSYWVEGYARQPFVFLLAAALVLNRFIRGYRLELILRDTMGAVWRRSADAPTSLPTGAIFWLRNTAFYRGALYALKEWVAPPVFALLLLVIGVEVVSHFAFNIADVAGWTCTGTPEQNQTTLKGGQASDPPLTFDISKSCQPTGIVLESGATYTIKVVGQDWTDRGYPIPVGGFSDAEPSHGVLRAVHLLALPLRRELFQDWFRVVLRYGPVGGEEVFLQPDRADPILETRFKPTRNGELFLFVNDAVLGLPYLYDWFYRNNRGTATVTVKRIR